MGQAVFPRLASYATSLDWVRLRRTIAQAAAAVIALAVPAMLGLVLLGRTVIRVLFEHGEFGADAGDLTNDVLIAYAIALPAYVTTEVVTRGLIALSDTRTPLLTNALQLAGRAAIIALLLGEVGAVAIPVAFAVTASIETVLLAGVLAWKLQRAQQLAAQPA